ncbi:hypothetical protein H632_c1798p0, partial [Helicosporidium sp. ATCC 50920]
MENASKEQLSSMLVDTLRKLKTRDKRLQALEAQLSQAGSDPLTTPASLSSEVAPSSWSEEKRRLEEAVSEMQARFMRAEESFAERLAAEVELVTSQMCQAETRLQKAQAEAADLSQQLRLREARLADADRELESSQGEASRLKRALKEAEALSRQVDAKHQQAVSAAQERAAQEAGRAAEALQEQQKQVQRERELRAEEAERLTQEAEEARRLAQEAEEARR